MNGSVLNQASRQWAKRPADESYLSLQSLHEAVEKRTAATVSASDIRFTDLSIAPRDEDLVLVSSRGAEATFNNWSFSQFCSRVGAPTDFMRQLPADLASKCLNYRIVHPENDGGAANMLFHKNGHLTLRAFTGTSYSRIWDMDITSRLLRLPEQWQPAPETTLPNGGKCRGLYASDHDIFVFLVDNNRRVFESLPGGGLSRGFMVANSEVGDKAFWMLTFLYSHICANHNVWGVQDINELRIRHVGDANDRAFERLGIVMRRYANASASEDETRIKRCMAKE
ncbi:MAG: DUF932 domain-containing protein, partial [Armatimonadetes bacterium]|nr:DUF932 domain-containing protein [Armatimonadota bacterium]